MTIAIDTSPLDSGHSKRGIGVYTAQLVEALRIYEKDHTVVQVNGKEKVSVPVDIVHYPFFDPFFLTLPWKKKKHVVVTVHDLIPIIFPDYFPRGMRGEIKWQIQKFFLSRVDRIITDSHISKADIVRVVGFDETRIDVIPLAPAPVYRKIIRLEEVRKTVKQISHGDPYLLFVGDVNWNKNIPRLLSAFQKTLQLYKQKSKTLKLVCVGKAFLNVSLPEVRAIRSLMRDLRIDDSVITPGYISDEELRSLYRGSQLTIVPSLYEGFGFPVLEAMVCGSTVVASSAGSLSEIVGPAVTIDPCSVEDMANGIVKALNFSAVERMKRLSEQKKWASQFTWEKVARETVQSYMSVLS